MGEEGAAAPLLDGKIKINGEGAASKGEEAAGSRRWWWRGGVWDAEEAAGQVAFAAPMVATSMAFYAIPLVSVMYAGRIGDVELAGATLGNSWGTVTGIALMVCVN
jgi:MATE family multidrug resistance protein